LFDKSTLRLLLVSIDLLLFCVYLSTCRLPKHCPVPTVRVPFSVIMYEANEFIKDYENGRILERLQAELNVPDSRVAIAVVDLRRVIRANSNKAMRQLLTQSSSRKIIDHGDGSVH
jgi:hypothetical protein